MLIYYITPGVITINVGKEYKLFGFSVKYELKGVFPKLIQSTFGQIPHTITLMLILSIS